eukprot:62026-Pyramimonas_sp.AAC.1
MSATRPPQASQTAANSSEQVFRGCEALPGSPGDKATRPPQASQTAARSREGVFRGCEALPGSPGDKATTRPSLRSARRNFFSKGAYCLRGLDCTQGSSKVSLGNSLR